MAGSNGRAKRHFFGGTGLYIALFLGVTALAVAGYWTLLPKNTTDKDAENVSSQVELPLEDALTLFSKAGYYLTNTDPFDTILEYFIEQGNYDLFALNEALYQRGQTPLWS